MDNGNGDETAFDDERNFSCPPAILFFLFFISSSWSGHYFWTLRQVFFSCGCNIMKDFSEYVGKSLFENIQTFYSK